MAVVRKKQDDKYLKVLRELVSATGGGNRQCFDCGQKGPTYVNMTIGSFVCTRCSGVLRGLTPPHRVKSISMATFTPEEIEFLKSHGNDSCAKTWLGLWDPKRSVHQDHRELMIDKYERKRYFLEPASPLKSLTNATNLKSSTTPVAASNCSSSATHSSLSNNSSHNNFNGSSTNINNNNNNNNNIYNNNTTVTSNNFSNGFGNNNLNGNGNISNLAHKQNSIDSSFQNITLTPPAPHRSHNNGVQKSASAISRPTQQQNGYAHSHPHQGGFATLLSSASSSARNGNDDAFITSNGYHHPGSSFNGNVLSGHNGFNNGGLLNGLNISGSSSTGANSDTSSSTSNGFGPDADFVADFNSANIFDATSTAAGSSPAVVVPSKASIGGSSSLSTNGYAKIQAIAAAQLMNGNPPLIMNGNGNTVGHHNHQNGVGGLSTTAAALNHNGNAENFADFEHAPIFVAAGLPMSNGNKSVTSSRSAFNSNSPAIDRYAALKDLDEQLRESKAVAAAAASIVSTSVVESFGGAHNNNNSSSVNPFKNVSTSQQQQPQQNANPFQPNPAINPSAVTAATTATASSGVASLFGSMPTQANATMTNGFAINGIPNQLHHHHQQQQQQAFLNFSNGFASTTAAASHSNGATMFPSGGPNGCGFGYGSVQQQISTSGGGGAAAFNNPFAATGSLNTNNPFL